jgi:transcriptional regulator with PAS, ATPase and Fis domain
VLCSATDLNNLNNLSLEVMMAPIDVRASSPEIAFEILWDSGTDVPEQSNKRFVTKVMRLLQARGWSEYNIRTVNETLRRSKRMEKVPSAFVIYTDMIAHSMISNKVRNTLGILLNHSRSIAYSPESLSIGNPKAVLRELGYSDREITYVLKALRREKILCKIRNTGGFLITRVSSNGIENPLGEIPFVKQEYNQEYNKDNQSECEEFGALMASFREKWPEGLNQIVGVGKMSKEIREMVQIVASAEITDQELAPVLITGETGTGKELVAEMIHKRSRRRNESFCPINCAAVPGELLESELFGHEQGAFTGATRQKPGWFDIADQGTIFLDEIGDTEPAFQSKVLRVLENGQYSRLGGTKMLKTRARVLAATNRNLAKMIEEGSFRPDLLYRLDVFSIHISPLRQRIEDILPIFAFLVVKRERGLKIQYRLTPSACNKLVGYRWPGNVRELRNVALRACVFAETGLVRDEHIRFSSHGRPN